MRSHEHNSDAKINILYQTTTIILYFCAFYVV
nr:MAG TPA: hypothetical protein [Caudoviricetes sp.]